MSIDSSLIQLSALEVVELLRRKEVSPIDLLDTLKWQVDRVESFINALPTVCWERAYAHANKLMSKPVLSRGILCGLPIPIKDLTPVSGVRTTYGSTAYRDHIPALSDAVVTRVEDNGAIVYAKSNSPEFGAGGHTVNSVFGLTRNPWNIARSAGGSSGGAAAALASGTAWLAQGSDLAGSLRTPAAFCGVVGLRPTPGRVGYGPLRNPFDTLSVVGPMAKNVTDAALFLDAMCGTNHGAPLSVDGAQASFLGSALSPRKPVRIGFSADLGVTTVEPDLLRICREATHKLNADGIDVEEVKLDLSAATQAFHALRGLSFATNYAAVLAEYRVELDPHVIWNIEYGLNLDARRITAAYRARAELFHKVTALFETYDVIVCPASVVPPFPVEERYVREAAGRQFDTYIDWLAITYSLTLLSLPVIALPCGMTADGLPVAIQIVGKPRGEAELLSIARALEIIIGPWSSTEPQLTKLVRDRER